MMVTVPAGEFQRNFGRYQDEALKHPVVITRNNRERLVVLSIEEYHRLKQRDREVLKTEEMTMEQLRAITEGEMDSRHNHLDVEME